MTVLSFQPKDIEFAWTGIYHNEDSTGTLTEGWYFIDSSNEAIGFCAEEAIWGKMLGGARQCAVASATGLRDYPCTGAKIPYICQYPNAGIQYLYFRPQQKAETVEIVSRVGCHKSQYKKSR